MITYIFKPILKLVFESKPITKPILKLKPVSTKNSTRISHPRTAVLLFSLWITAGLISGCGLKSDYKGSKELTDGIPKSEVELADITDPSYDSTNPREEITEFSLELLREKLRDDNCLISPLSIVSALGMTANGAGGNTRTQMEQAMHTDTAVLNDYLEAYTVSMPEDEKYKVNIANSIWFKDVKGLAVNEDFLRTVKSCYNASIYKAPFDTSTKNEINSWIKRETNGMIKTLLEEAPPEDAVMYLINALSFDGEWQKIYEKDQIHDGSFTNSNGVKQAAVFMNSTEYAYLETANGTGFIKPYKDGAYAFAALLPDEGVEMAGFLEELKGEDLIKLLEEAQDKTVYVRIPKFTAEYSADLNDCLIKLGMKEAFDSETADFRSMAQSEHGNIYISKVIHKTKIEVDEKGTKAGAVTMAAASEGSAIEPETLREVCLDRPFFYMIIDTKQELPLFMGCMMQAE